LDLLADDLLFVLKAPLLLVGRELLGSDGLGAVFIDLPHEVDAGLVFLVPLVLSKFPLFLAFEPGEVFNQLLLSLLVFGLLKIELLKVNDFLPSTEKLLSLDTLDFLLLIDSLAEHVFVALLFNTKLLFTEKFLGFVVTDKFEIALAVKHLTLALKLMLLLLLALPLLIKHLALLVGKLAVLGLILQAGVFLPVEDCHGIADTLLLFFSFFALTFLLRLEVEFPELSVNLLLHDLLVGLALLIDELLLSFHLALIDKELALLLAKVVSRYLN
jgi:hypothetical protein